MKKRGAVYEAPEYASADPEIARFAEQHLLIRGTTARTREAYQRDLEHFGSFLKARALDAKPDVKQPPPYEQLAGAVYADVLAYQTHLARSRRYAPRSVRRKIASIRTYYKSLRMAGRRDDNPAADAILPKIGKPLPKALRREDVEDVLGLVTRGLAGQSELQRRRDRALFACLWSCGMRRAELIGLDLTDVDLENRLIRVVKGKGNKDRLVPLTVPAAATLRAYLDLRPASAVPAVFLGRGDRRLSASGLYKIVRTYMELAGIADHASPHTWRHTVATIMREHGADLLFLKEFLGHESTATTEIYTKLAHNRLRAEFEKFHPQGEDGD
ncbi:MAG TPA: tyrosine-type recombinase/integrase [Candidatus Sulfotelmatobacter sp.]|nr:tyrosine-type recombinase/integrase [Candidatus Sulfotelmatobacter sp.]